MKDTFKISVRHLVEYVFRGGSIDSRFRTSTSMTEGTKAHQKIQKTYKDNDEHEVFLHMEKEQNDIIFEIEGRCDGLLFTEAGVTIDEIKSTSKELDFIQEDSFPVHWAQAKFYAYMYAVKNELSTIEVQLTYYQVLTEEVKRFQEHFSVEELSAFVAEVLAKYERYARMLLKNEKEKLESIKTLAFPFATYREGQRKLAGSVYKTIIDGRNLFAKAPTGIGKTMSTIFPSIKAMGEGHIQKFSYLTARTITRQAAEEAFKLLVSNGLSLHTVTITAKDKVCYQDGTSCCRETCSFSEGYYDRINDAAMDILTNEKIMTRQVIGEYAQKHHVCPFEYSLDLAYSSDVMICDYNYVFDPRVSLKRYIDEQKRKSVLLIDEAHNLVDRAREMYSAVLLKSPFLEIKRSFIKKNKDLANIAKKINDQFIIQRKAIGEEKALISKVLDEEWENLLNEFIVHAEKELLNGPADEVLLDTYYNAQSFVKTAKLFDERFVVYSETERNEVRLKLFCLDPSQLIRQFGKGFRSKIYFSATLTPIDYFQEMLGSEEDDYTLSVPSPFQSEQTDVFISPLSTKFHDRNRTKVKISKLIGDLITERPGNYFIFFPSYAYLLEVYREFQHFFPHVKTIVQDRMMTEEERESFLEAFQDSSDENVIGFAVLGGIFSEGVDLKGDRLNGVVVVGVGLPQLGLERNIIKDHFTNHGRNGYDYSYMYPGMNKVLQAGGRLIRSETDSGTILLVDDRFLENKYQILLPQEWRNFTIIH